MKKNLQRFGASVLAAAMGGPKRGASRSSRNYQD